jgi:hypothetical protein
MRFLSKVQLAPPIVEPVIGPTTGGGFISWSKYPSTSIDGQLILIGQVLTGGLQPNGVIGATIQIHHHILHRPRVPGSRRLEGDVLTGPVDNQAAGGSQGKTELQSPAAPGATIDVLVLHEAAIAGEVDKAAAVVAALNYLT